MKIHLPLHWTLLAAAALLCLGLPTRAAEAFLQDLTSGESQDLPVWMEGPPMATPALHATVSFPIQPPATEDDLLVTIFFQEKKGGFLRVYWDDGYNKEMLCENLAEGTGMLSRRTLLIKRPVMVSAGLLTFQSSEATLGVERIYWQWSHLQPAYLEEPWFAGGLLQRGGSWLPDDEIDGYTPTPHSDAWSGRVVTAPISQKPDRIENGVEFIAELTELPKTARIRVKIAGLPLTSALHLWINGRATSALQVPVPDLADPGLQTTGDGPLQFTGWREATLLVDVSLLTIGDNRFQFQAQPESVPADAALAVKDFDIQLQYP